jgi:hypothetical protein
LHELWFQGINDYFKSNKEKKFERGQVTLLDLMKKYKLIKHAENDYYIKVNTC